MKILKDKFSKSYNDDILKYLLIEFKKSLEAADEHAIIYVGNELASFLRLIGDVQKNPMPYMDNRDLLLRKIMEIDLKNMRLVVKFRDVDIVNKDYGKGLDRFNLAYEILKQYPVMTIYFASLLQ